MIFGKDEFNFRAFLLEQGFSFSMRHSNMDIYRRGNIMIEIRNYESNEVLAIWWKSSKLTSLNFLPTLKLFSEMLIWEAENAGCAMETEIIK